VRWSCGFDTAIHVHSVEIVQPAIRLLMIRLHSSYLQYAYSKSQYAVAPKMPRMFVQPHLHAYLHVYKLGLRDN
jgi:hypothetical protein